MSCYVVLTLVGSHHHHRTVLGVYPIRLVRLAVTLVVACVVAEHAVQV